MRAAGLRGSRPAVAGALAAVRQDADAHPLRLDDRGLPRFAGVQTGARRRDPECAQTIDCVLDALPARVRDVIAGQGGDVEADVLQRSEIVGIGGPGRHVLSCKCPGVASGAPPGGHRDVGRLGSDRHGSKNESGSGSSRIRSPTSRRRSSDDTVGPQPREVAPHRVRASFPRRTRCARRDRGAADRSRSPPQGEADGQPAAVEVVDRAEQGGDEASPRLPGQGGRGRGRPPRACAPGPRAHRSSPAPPAQRRQFGSMSSGRSARAARPSCGPVRARVANRSSPASSGRPVRRTPPAPSHPSERRSDVAVRGREDAKGSQSRNVFPVRMGTPSDSSLSNGSVATIDVSAPTSDTRRTARGRCARAGEPASVPITANSGRSCPDGMPLRTGVALGPGHGHQSAERLEDRVHSFPPGAGRAEATDRGVDDSFVQLRTERITGAEAVGRARREVLDDDVRVADELAENSSRPRGSSGPARSACSDHARASPPTCRPHSSVRG